MSGGEKAGWANLAAPLQGIIAMLTILAFVVPPTAAFILFDTRIKTNKESISSHKISDEKRWDSNSTAMSGIESDIDEAEKERHALQLQNAVIETRFNQILNEMQALNHKIDRWEPAEGQ